MKRSNMVHEIKIYLQNGTSTDTRDLERHAENILKMIEDKGMLPPDIDKMIEGHLCTDNKWESEDVV